MDRRIIEVPMGQDQVRSTVRITDDPGEATGFAGFQALGSFLQTIVGAPHALLHAKACPDEVHIRHNGTAWVLETVSYVERKPDGPASSRPASPA